jgi:hypothetical protein
MMMAPDSTSNAPVLDAETLASLEAALEEFLRADDSIAAVEPSLRRIAAEARTKGMQAEQLLIVLKDVWYGLGSINDARDNAAQNAMLQRVVSCCIRAYYSM